MKRAWLAVVMFCIAVVLCFSTQALAKVEWNNVDWFYDSYGPE